MDLGADPILLDSADRRVGQDTGFFGLNAEVFNERLKLKDE
jgi:hypothetical protein